MGRLQSTQLTNMDHIGVGILGRLSEPSSAQSRLGAWGYHGKQNWEELGATGKKASCLRRTRRYRKRWKQQSLPRALLRARDETWSLDFLLIELKKALTLSAPQCPLLQSAVQRLPRRLGDI